MTFHARLRRPFYQCDDDHGNVFCVTYSLRRARRVQRQRSCFISYMQRDAIGWSAS
jgi:hypothetical protein